MYWINYSDPLSINSSRQVPFWADYNSDISLLPRYNVEGVQQGENTISCQPVEPGSMCTVIEDASVWVLGMEDNQWHKL